MTARVIFVTPLPALESGTISTGALLFVLAAWSCGALVATVIAALLAPAKPFVHGVIAGDFILVPSIAMLVLHSHPTWFLIAACVLMPLAIAAGAFGVHALRGKKTKVDAG